MQLLLTILLCFVLTNSVAQNKSIIEMVRENSGMELKIDELENYVAENINEKQQIAEFFYYWIGINVKYNREILEKNKTEDEQKKYSIGDEIHFTTTYMAVARLLNSKFIDKQFM